jgi:DNA (cytosine-5)-methyltransferase 1
MRDATNGTFPRWTVWENVAGALSSNNGRDFGTVINEMAKAGAHLQEFALLDAQHFGIPQRRRRVFLISCFDPATADRCPDPLLPVTESLRGDTKKGKPKRQSAASATTDSVRGDGGILGSEIVGSLNTSDAKMISTQYVNENKCVVEPYVKSRRAQSADDDETWIEGKVNPTLNSFDVGDTRSTTVVVGSLQARDYKGVNHEGARDGKLIIEQPMLVDGTRVDDVRVYDPPVQTLGARMGTGGNNVPMLAFDTQFGSNANVFEDQSPTLKASQAAPSVAYDSIVFDDDRRVGPRIFDETIGTLQAFMGTGGNNTPMVAQPIEPTMAVRRLTPLECERLMGWPDDHTRYKADGTEQADTHRYKQCGNGVASPVAKWVASHIAKVEHGEG